MGKQCIFLEYGVKLAFVGGDPCDVLPFKHDFSRILGDKAAEYTQGGGLAAAAGAQQGDEAVFPDGKI